MNDQLTPWMEQFAAKHGLAIRFERATPGGVPAYKYDGPTGPFVVLDATLPPERQHFALAHEAAHVLLGHSGEVMDEEEMEANHLAAELLLPREAFSSDAWRSLRELKELFPHASFEAIARRRLAFLPGVLTIFDNGHVTRRLSADGFAAPPSPIPPEWSLVERCYAEKGDLEDDVHGLHLAATYVDTGDEGIVRVLLIVEEA